MSSRYPHGNAYKRRSHYAYEDSALNLAYKQNNSESQTDQEQPERRLIKRGHSGHAGVKRNNAYIQQADISNKNAYSSAYSVLKAAGDRFNYIFAKLGDSDEDID